eukprot:c15320_g1_i1 orf=598-1209(-)
MGREDLEAENSKINTQPVDEAILESQGILEMKAPEIHVLAVDDSVIDRKVIERLLKISAYKVTTVESGLRALEILGLAESSNPLRVNAHINLIITDYCMPEMTGYDLLKRVKEAAALKEIPVVIMSSENVPNRIKSCMAEGAEEFILKPLQLADVMRLRGHIRQTRLHAMKQSAIPCIKRKISSDTLQAPNSKRPHVDGVTVS